MYNFSYTVAESLEHASVLLAGSMSAVAIAGGTDLLPRIYSGKCASQTLVDLLPLGLNDISTDKGTTSVGALTCLSAVIDALECTGGPLRLLSISARNVGACQTRSQATIGGNICTGNPSADIAPALLALDALLVLHGPYGRRTIGIQDFFLGPRKVGLQQGEILTEIVIPKAKQAGPSGCGFLKIGRRKGMEISTANAAAVVTLDGEAISDASIAVGTLAEIPKRLPLTEAYLMGKVFDERTKKEAGDIMRMEISPRTSRRATQEYREAIAPVLMSRVVQAAIDDAKVQRYDD